MIEVSSPLIPSQYLLNPETPDDKSQACSLKHLMKTLNPQNRRDVDEKICTTVDKMLQTKEGLPIKELLGEVHNDPILVLARKLLHKRRGDIAKDPSLQLLQRRLTAVKLGLRAEDLEGQDHFQAFARVNYLHRYLLAFDHTLKVDPASKEILIMHKGEYRPWSEVRQSITVNEDGVLQGRYGRNGLQDEDVYTWTKLKPFKWEDPRQWQEQYLFEHCMWTHKDLQLTDNHSWIRLRTPKGDVYSVGDWPLDKGERWSWVRFPLRLKPGRLMSPDISEFWRGVEVSSLSFAITKDQFKAMKAQIEEDKQTPTRAYHVFHRNCTSYVNKIAAIAGIETPTTVPVNKIITPKPLRGVIGAVQGVLPSPIRRTTENAFAVFFNLFATVMGNHIGGDPKNPSVERRRPRLPGLKELTTLPHIDHPHSALYQLSAQVEQWRKEETARLSERRLAMCRELLHDNLSDRQRQKLQSELETIEKEERMIPYRLPIELHTRKATA